MSKADFSQFVGRDPLPNNAHEDAKAAAAIGWEALQPANPHVASKIRDGIELARQRQNSFDALHGRKGGRNG